MSVWVIGLGLAAGFLINKNLTMDHRIKDATKKYNEAAQSETQEIRKVQRTVPPADKYQDMNLQDLPKKDVDKLTANQEQARQSVAAYEQVVAPPQILGVWLSNEKGL